MRLECPDYWKSLINMGLSRFFILRTLHEGPTHGYALLDRLRAFTEGCCAPSFGTIYPILKELKDGGYATSQSSVEEGRQRRVYELTSKGELAYQRAIDTWREVLPYIEKAVRERDAQ